MPDATNLYFEVYRQSRGIAPGTGLLAAAQGDWRWRLRAGNHEPIASGEGYHNKEACEAAISLLMSTDHATPVKYR